MVLPEPNPAYQGLSLSCGSFRIRNLDECETRYISDLGLLPEAPRATYNALTKQRSIADNEMLATSLICIAVAALILLMSRPAPVYAAAGEFRRELYKFRSHTEAARRALLTPKQLAYEDWCLAWYKNNKHKYEDREAELDAFEAASKEWNDTH